MIPAGYMAKRVSTRAEWLKAPQVVDIYSVSACESACFGDFLEHWKHNGHWLFDSPALLQEVARADGIALSETKLFYYEVHEFEFDDRDARRPAIWSPLEARMSVASNVVVPAEKALEGYDVTELL